MPNDMLAVVTGASSGIGYELARQFAEHDYDLVIIAEDDGIADAAERLSGNGTRVSPIQADLATDEGADLVIDTLQQAGRPIDALAVNAGIGASGAFVDIPWPDQERLLRLNVGSAVRMANGVLPDMVRRGSGRVLFTASTASTMPGPYYATYAASKAFVLSFAEALRHEVKDAGVTVTALMPGATDTNFFDRAGMQGTPAYEAKKDDPAEVARDGFDALMAGKDHVVAGSAKNKAQVLGTKAMTEPMKAVAHAKLTEPQSK